MTTGDRLDDSNGDAGSMRSAEGNETEKGNISSAEDRSPTYEDHFAGMPPDTDHTTSPSIAVDPHAFTRHHHLPAVLRQIYTKSLYNRIKANSFEVTDSQLKQDRDLAKLSGDRDLEGVSNLFHRENKDRLAAYRRGSG